jgi:hypothetical protein
VWIDPVTAQVIITLRALDGIGGSSGKSSAQRSMRGACGPFCSLGA